MRDLTEKEKRIMAECQRIKTETNRTMKNGYDLPDRVMNATRKLWTAAQDTQEKILDALER